MHPSQERRDLNPLDIGLRRCGFKIHSRAGGQPAVWSLGGKLYDVAKAAEFAGLDPCTGKGITSAEEVTDAVIVDDNGTNPLP